MSEPCAREDPGAPPLLFPSHRSIVARSPREPLVRIPQTLTETTGPGAAWHGRAGGAVADLTTQHAGAPLGQRIIVAGRVLDERARPVPHTLIGIWQANAVDRYAGDDRRDDVSIDSRFTGFGRAATDDDGVYRFRTTRRGRVPGPGNSLQAPHVALSVLGRSILKRLATRLYFAGGDGNEDDPILSLVPAHRRDTLIAARRGDGTWWLDTVLQGARETVFFDL